MNVGQLIILGIGFVTGAITLYLLLTTDKQLPHKEK
jgi:hypothetical protein